MTNLYIKLLHEDSLTPKQQTTHAACYDVHAYIRPNKGDSNLEIKAYNALNIDLTFFQEYDDTYLILHPGCRALIPTGIKVCCDEGYKIQLVPRSGLSFKKGLILSNSIGTIDADYRGELFVMFTNTTKTNVTIEHGDRIAQIELIELTPTTIIIGELPPTNSNRKGGIGHTG